MSSLPCAGSTRGKEALAHAASIFIAGAPTILVDGGSRWLTNIEKYASRAFALAGTNE